MGLAGFLPDGPALSWCEDSREWRGLAQRPCQLSVGDHESAQRFLRAGQKSLPFGGVERRAGFLQSAPNSGAGALQNLRIGLHPVHYDAVISATALFGHAVRIHGMSISLLAPRARGRSLALTPSS